jgi:hypothetical protein
VSDLACDAEFDELFASWPGNRARVFAPGRGFCISDGYVNCAIYAPPLFASAREDAASA